MKVALRYVGWFVVSTIWAGCTPESSSPSATDAPEAQPFEEQRHDSLLTAYSLALADGNYLAAEQGSETLILELGPSHEDADTLRAIADRAEELRLYAAARAIPGSQSQENATAYRDLAIRYPDTPTYREKADYYERRIRETAASRAQSSASGTGGSARRSTGDRAAVATITPQAETRAT